MWQLEDIKATNICAFEKLEYSLKPNCATLVFGDNMDDDSQNSNGSGKSALIEAIAISITGETLRKVNMDEIINDAHDTATLMAVFYNPEDKVRMTVQRSFTRKKPQTIAIYVNRTTGDHEGEVEEIKLASVIDYNHYILEEIGVSKEDIFSNYILTAKKYHSFLSSSDREKKDIINRFSNGILVDESIEALHEDMQPVQDSLTEAEMKVSECTGRVSALETEIERAMNESADRSANKKARIESWKQAIVDKRGEKRDVQEEINKAKAHLDKLDELDEKMQDLEKGKYDFSSAYNEIQESFAEYGLSDISDYGEQYSKLNEDKKAFQDKMLAANTELSSVKKEFNKASKNFEKLKSDYDSELADVNSELDEATDAINLLAEEISRIRNKEVGLNRKRAEIYSSISDLEKQLAGTIVCPKCKHEFLLSGDSDVSEVRALLKDKKAIADDVERQITKNQDDYDKCVENGKKARQTQTDLADKKVQMKRDFQKSEMDLEDIVAKHARLDNSLSTLQSNIDNAISRLESLKRVMFDETFDVIDSEIKDDESKIKNCQLKISNIEGAITSYKESIEEAENAVETDMIASLKESKAKYEKSLQKSIKEADSIKRQLNELKAQESTFIEFKTHLANTKIDAISQITNSFLETIGSDIRVVFSGYTVLKSGKVRDKISVSLLRDGTDCGSFDKFSRGEQTRVELACILAMHELINMNCLGSKGLNLLVIDEILDAADEQGLTSVFKAINETKITSLVVSHGNVAENYPNRLVVHKKNGVSFI